MEARENPTALKVVAGLFVLLGVCSVIQVVVLLSRGHINLNFGVLGLLIGPGLLRRSRGWRTCALVFLWIAFVLIPIFIIIALGRKHVDLDVFGIPVGKAPSGAGIVFGLLLFALAFWQYRVLTRPDIMELFYPPQEDASPDRSENPFL